MSTPADTPNPNPKSDARRRVSTMPRATGEATAEEDLAHSIRGETVVDRAQRVGGPPPSTPAVVTYHRRRKSSRPETSKWQTALNVITKLCFLVLGLLGLGKMILQVGSANGGPGSYPFAALDQDSRISDLESLLKKTAKMFQVQLDVVDKRIGSEIGGLKKEISKRVEEKVAVLETGLKNLEKKTDDISSSLNEMKASGLLSKDEFESFKSEMKKRGLDGKNIGLTDIKALAKEIIAMEIEKHAADGLGRADYALASGGGKVIMHSEPFVSGKGSWFGVKDSSRVHPNAQKMLEPSFGEPGQCFALKGNAGFVEIKLRAAVIPESVTLEHVAKSVAYDRSSAPKDCTVSAWFEQLGQSQDPETLTKFSYDLEKSNAQTFNLETVNTKAINVVRLDFTSNHGNPSLTCIYRFRVHGQEHEVRKFEHPSASEGKTSQDQR